MTIKRLHQCLLKFSKCDAVWSLPDQILKCKCILCVLHLLPSSNSARHLCVSHFGIRQESKAAHTNQKLPFLPKQVRTLYLEVICPHFFSSTPRLFPSVSFPHHENWQKLDVSLCTLASGLQLYLDWLTTNRRFSSWLWRIMMMFGKGVSCTDSGQRAGTLMHL